MTPEQIAQNAAAVRNAGMPDALNRWLKMTPEAWAANEAARANMRNGHMAKIGAKEQQIRETRIEQSRRGPLKAMIDAASVPKVTVTAPNGVAVAELGPGQSATFPAADAACKPPEAATTKESPMSATTKTKTAPKVKTSKLAKTAGARTKKAARSTARTPVKAKTEGARPGTKLAEIVKLLQRPAGCTTADVLKATGWPAVSMPQQAKAASIEMVTEKVGRTTTYWAKGHEPERLQKPAKA